LLAPAAAAPSPSAASPEPVPAATGNPTTSPSVSAAPAQPANQQELQQLLATATCDELLKRNRAATDDPKKQLVACNGEQTEKYLLDAAGVVGTDVDDATAGLDAQTSTDWQVVVDFTGGGTRKFGDLTTRTVNKQVAIVLDAEVISAPNINEPITGGSAQITGDFTQREAEELANVLKYGALPVTFAPQSAETVSPTLGEEQLRGGLLAGAIGLALVVVYSLVYYRALGLVTIASLVISGLIIYASVVLLGRYIGYTLSLAGIAGFIVAVGITADSFVVFFERLRDEVREGRSVRSGVERGWVDARRTILSANFIAVLAAVVLYFLSVGAVKGFAFTLGLSTLVDTLIVFLFTKPIVAVLARTAMLGKGGPISGLGAKSLLKPARTPAVAGAAVAKEA
ncbi:MAG: protein translocase subunit SecD, partial [Actinomycetota bacterium]|nr:protein translocase subunit SecD [Actinomycetota bacterium]